MKLERKVIQIAKITVLEVPSRVLQGPSNVKGTFANHTQRIIAFFLNKTEFF